MNFEADLKNNKNIKNGKWEEIFGKYNNQNPDLYSEYYEWLKNKTKQNRNDISQTQTRIRPLKRRRAKLSTIEKREFKGLRL